MKEHSYNRILSKCYSVIVVSLLGLHILLVEGSLTKWPANTEVVVGQTVHFSCSTSERYFINWERFPLGSTEKQSIYVLGELEPLYHSTSRFRINRTESLGQYDLWIDRVELGDSGRYRCVDREGQGEKGTAELIVLGSTPRCSTEQLAIDNSSCALRDRDGLNITCRLSYSGNKVPSLRCPFDFNYTRTDNDDRSMTVVSYHASVNVDSDVISHSHNCHTALSNIHSNDFKANVTYIEQQRNRLEIHSPGTVTCEMNSSSSSTSSNSKCQYKWLRFDSFTSSVNQTVSNSKSILIQEPGLYLCEVDCFAAGIKCKIQPMEVLFKQPATSSYTTAAVVVSVTVVGFCLLVIFGLLYCIYFRQKESFLSGFVSLSFSAFTSGKKKEKKRFTRASISC